MMSPGRPWTTKRLQRVWEQLRSGVDVRTIAAQQGCTVNNIHKRLRLNGYDPAESHRADSSRDMHLERIYSMRKQGKEFSEIARELGMEPGPMATRCLYMRLIRYCERIGAEYPRGPRRVRQAKQRVLVMSEETIQRLVETLRERANMEQPTTVYDLALHADLPERDVKAYVAEMRRRYLIADGIVPLPKAVHAAGIITDQKNASCYDAVIGSVVEAWCSTGPCATLERLHETVPYSKSYINYAIVRLREEGYFALRGYLHLRDHV
jgi:hypothetical protein